MKSILITTLAFILSLFFSPVFSQQESAEQEQTSLSEEEQKYREWADSIWESLDIKTGTVELPNKVATLQLPKDFYYLNPQDAEKILVEVWGNPPGGITLGMIFPQQYTPFDRDVWGVTIQYQEDGYVSDEEADSIDYGDLLAQMKNDTELASEERVKNGYEAIRLVGWASQPYYDKNSKKLYWAKEIKFGDDPLHILNYNIRVLGRKGVLVLNFIASIDQLDEINANLNPVLAMTNFNDGFRYQDFDPEYDKVAAYGLGALVAGKVLSKAGFFAIALVFLKKFGVFIVIGVIAVFRALFGRKKAAT